MKAIDEITIYNPARSPYIADDGCAKFPITDSCERTAKIMGEDSVRLVFNLKHKVTFDAFSFIEYNGQAFFLKERYVPKSVGDKEVSGTIQSARYAYDVKFVSVANMLDKFVCYRHVEVDGKSWNEPEININGTLETLYVIIMGAIEQAASRLNPAWFFTVILHQIALNGLATVGGVVQPNTDKVRLTEGTQLLTFNFSGEKIANVCTTVANNFTNDNKKDTEWYITPVDTNTYEGATLHFAKCVKEDSTVRVFRDYMVERDGEYLAGELKSVDYVQEWSGIPEVIVPYGSDRNMSYRSVKAIDEITQMQSTFGKRLRLQPNKTGSNAYKFTDKDGNSVTIETDANGAIRNSLVTTGIEVVKFFDEIYPQCHFKVTSVSQKNKRQDGEIIPEYTVEAVPVDNDGNTINREDLTDNGFYPIKIEEATTLSVRFESGLLNGREFEIANKTSKDQGATTYSLKFTIVADGSIEDGTLIPSGNFIPRKDDTFALFNMKMPDVYVTYAELELAKRAYEELITLQSTRPEIKCESDETIFDEDIQFGDVLIVYSDRFDSDEPFRSRVISYSYKLSNPRAVTFNLASAIMQGTLSSMNELIADVTHTAGGLEQRAINLSRRGWRDASEVASMLNSLTADVVLVGNGRYQFGYAHEGKGVEVVHSTVGDETRTTAIKISHGTIEHTQDPYVDWVSKGFWEVSGETKTTAITENGEEALTAIPDTPLYLYAVVNENDTLLVTELTSIAHDAEEDEDYLLMGILSSEFEGRRVFSRTNGYTSLEGGTITTEIIQDAGRNLIIDFQSNPPRIIARNGAVIIGNIKFKASDEMTAEEQLAALGVDVSNALSAAEQATYTNIYNGGDISVSTDGSKEIVLKDAFIQLATLGCYVKFTKVSETPLLPFSKSCIIAVKKGTDVSQIYLHKDDIYAYLNWGDEYTPTEECDFYVALAEKEYIRDYLIPGAFDFIEYEMREVWTISGISVIVRTSDAIQSAMQAIANEEDARTEALAEAVSNINGGIDELQKQIDGEVSSYFYDTAPIAEDETILTDIPPFNEWAENYNLRNGVYVLKTGARNEFVNHLGDTYTNMQEYVSNEKTPLAGLSWRWCDATTVSPLPKQYITIRYTSNGSTITKQLHWHKIADSDAVKALQEAGRAQSTADHKSTIFTTKPSNYSVGDMWILMEDTMVGGTLYKKGTILNSSDNSETFDYRHWSEDVKYIDEDIGRQQAQQALDGLIVGGTNLIPAVGFGSSDSNQTITKLQEELYSQGVYQVTKITNATPPASVFAITQYVTAGKTYVASVYIRCDTAPSGTSLTKWGRIIFYGKDASGANVTYASSNIDAEPKVGQWYQRQVVYTIPSDFDASKETINIFCYAPSAADVKSSMSCIKLEEGNKATPTYNMPISSIAQWAEESLQQLSDMSNDGILTPQEKKNVSNEWSEIQGMYSVNSNNVTSLFGSSKPTEWTEYNTKYSNLRTYITSLNLGSGSNTTITKTTFQTKFSEYYNADVNLQKAIAKKSAELEVAAMEIGGRNLLLQTCLNQYIDKWSVWQSSKVLSNGWCKVTQNSGASSVGIITPKESDGAIIENGHSYILSFDCYLDTSALADSINANYCYLMFSSGGNYSIGNYATINKTPRRVSIPFTFSGNRTEKFGAMIGCNGANIPAFYIKDIKLEKGTKATDWTPAPEDVDAKVSALDYLKEALENDTDVTGGIVATTHIQLRDWTGKYIDKNGTVYNESGDGRTKQYKVNAGLSGLDDDNVLAWGGGDYEDAVEAAQNSDPESGNGTYAKKDGTEITTLIKKDGTGKIGIFKISDTQAIVKTNQGEVLIDATDDNGGVYIKNTSNQIKAAIVSGSIEQYIPESSTSGTITRPYSTALSSDYIETGAAGGTCTTNIGKTFWDNIWKAQSGYNNIITVSFENFTINQYLWKSSSGTPTGRVTVTFSLMKNNTVVSSKAITTGAASSLESSQMPNSYNNYITQATNQNFKLTDSTLYTPYNYSLKVSVTSSSPNCLGQLRFGGTIKVTYISSPAYIAKTIIATDGVLSAYDDSKYFMVQNTDKGQKIFAKGLNTERGTDGSGELYVTSDFINAFTSLCNTLKAAFDDVRFEGNNGDHSTAIATALQDVIDELGVTSIIANS